ncbi:MAG TPA: translocation/assembly module TamB domain-containing protein [Gemmatimonadaceae bacterium]
MPRSVRIILLGIAALVLLVVVGAVVLTGTYFGRERVRRFALDAVRSMVDGEVIVGRIDGNLLDRFDLIDVSILDEDGQPFLIADRLSARVALSPLLSRRIVVRSLHLENPVVTLSRGPAGRWNYMRIFRLGDTVTVEGAPGFGAWVDLHDITVSNGTLLVRQPYPADEEVRRTVGDSAAMALARETRVRVERVGGSLQQVMEFRDIDTRIPRLVAAHPDSTAISFRVRQLSMQATPLQAPDVVVRDMSGDVRVLDDTVTLRDVELHLPASRIEGALTYHVSAGDVELDLRSDTIALKDIQVLYPDLPDYGGGRLELKATIRDTATSEYQFTNTRLTVGSSRIAGKLGVAVNSDMIELRETDLQFTRFTTELVESMIPGLQVRIPGAFTGRARFSGPSTALRTDVNGTYDPARHPPFRLSARGVIGTGEVTRAQNLRLNIQSIPVTLAREFIPDLPIGGTANVDAVVSGASNTQFTGNATITHREVVTSTVSLAGSIVPSNRSMDLHVRLTPISLELAQRFAPETDFQGNVRGSGTIRGTFSDLHANLALQLPSGAVDVDGTFDLMSDTRTYRATAELSGVNVRAMVPTLPPTILNGTATVNGRGTTTRTVDATFAVHLRDATFDSTQVGEAIAVGAARDARVTIDTLLVRTPFAVATANGTFGLVEGTSGTLNYDVDLNTLSGLQRWIAVADTSLVQPRPLVRQQLARRARGDTIRTDVRDDSSIAAVLTRRQDPRRPAAVPVAAVPVAKAPVALARDSLAGAARIRGTLRGGVNRFTAEGRAAINHLIYNGYEVGRGNVAFTWADIGTPDVRLTAEAGVDSVRAAGFAFDSTHVEGTYRAGAGDVALDIFPGDTARYSVQARYALHRDHGEVHLQDVRLRMDSVTWRSAHPSAIRWQGGGFAIDSLDLRSGNGASRGRIFVHGEVPDESPGRIDIRVDSVEIGRWATLLQTELPFDGIASLDALIEGTRMAPRMRGSFALERHNYRMVPFPEIHSTFTYDDRRFRFEGDLRREAAAGGRSLATIQGEIPIDLSLAGGVKDRKLPGPIVVDLEGDSIPLAPLGELVEEFSVVTGEARGRIGIRGTWERIRGEGAVTINVPRLGLRTPGVAVTNLVGRLTMADDRLVIDSLIGYSEGPIRATGSILLADLERPVLDLRVAANDARILDNEKGELVVSSQLAFKGPLDTLEVDGTLTVIHGLVRIPEPEEFKLISTGDPALFAVTDSSTLRALEIEPPSPILKNADVNVRLEVRRGTWARSREANIEIFGDLAIERATGDEMFSVTGSLHSDYGDYELYGRRFSVTRGTVRFTGPPTNPVLQLLATHEVRQAGRAPFDIQVSIGGTLEQPKLSLESDAQPALTQSDLISFLAFGRSSSSLLQFDGSGLEGGGMSGSSLAGNVAALATRQLGGVALGALFAELESDLSERTAADVLRIRPAELPTGLSLGDFETLARGTQIEIGKYLDRNTFFVGQFRTTFAVPGATLERRFGTQFRVRTSLETRYQPLPPSLTSGLTPKPFQVFAALLRWTRTW